MKWPNPRFAQAPADATGAATSSTASDDVGAKGAAAAGADSKDTSSSATAGAGAAGAAAGEKGGKVQERQSVLGNASGQGDGSQAAKGQDAKGGQDAGEKGQQAPTPVKVTAPEGVSLNKEILEQFGGYATEAGMTQEEAQGLVDWFGKVDQQRVAAERATLDAWDKKNFQTLEKDPEFGGKNLTESTAAVQRAVKKFGGEPFAKFLREQRLDNVPEVAKFLAAVGRAVGEDRSSVEGAGGGTKPATPAARNARFYDSADSKRARGEQ